MSATDLHRAIKAVWRIESARVIAGLTRLTRDVGLSEDLVKPSSPPWNSGREPESPKTPAHGSPPPPNAAPSMTHLHTAPLPFVSAFQLRMARLSIQDMVFLLDAQKPKRCRRPQHHSGLGDSRSTLHCIVTGRRIPDSPENAHSKRGRSPLSRRSFT